MLGKRFFLFFFFSNKNRLMQEEIINSISVDEVVKVEWISTSIFQMELYNF